VNIPAGAQGFAAGAHDDYAWKVLVVFPRGGESYSGTLDHMTRFGTYFILQVDCDDFKKNYLIEV
jgi:hypothetical protein